MPRSTTDHRLPDLYVVVGEDRYGEAVRKESFDPTLAAMWAAQINQRGGSVGVERHAYNGPGARWDFEETVL